MKETSIKCTNPDCHADNPANAKFCRKCGQPIVTDQGEYTPDLFPDIDLIPISLKTIRFVNGWQKFSFILLPIAIVFLVLVGIEYEWEYKKAFGRDAWEITMTIGAFCFVVFAISTIVGLKNVCRLAKYNRNTDFVENKYFIKEIRRIAKDKKIGMFDEKAKKVLLKPRFTGLSKLPLDEQHILVEENARKGLYSIPRKKLIIPIVFDDIKPDKIGTFAAVKDTQVFHYDIYGKELR